MTLDDWRRAGKTTSHRGHSVFYRDEGQGDVLLLAVLARLSNERGFGRSFCAIFGPRTQPSQSELHDFWRLVDHEDGSGIMHLLIHYIEERRRFRERWVGALQKSDVPLRFVNGPLDPVSGAHMAERYRELVPRADVVLLDGIGHYPQVEDPEGVLKAYFAFLESSASRGA